MDADRARDILRRNLQAVEDRLRAACRRAGRERSEVTLVVVTKSVSAEAAALWPELGVDNLGENRPQELWRKAALMPAGIRWHMIGHLQRNKVERTLPMVALIHAVDSLRLLHAVEEEAAKRGQTVPALLEVNASREASKQGLAPEDMPGLADPINKLNHVHVIGLMTMAAPEDDPQRCRPTFTALRELRDRLAAQLGRALPQLSMGMSNDFEVAVEEGATLVRIGSALYEGLPG